MTRRKDKARKVQFFVPHGSEGVVWGVVDYCMCSDEGGIQSLQLFSSEQVAKQYADKWGLTARPMHVYGSMQPLL